MMRLLAHPIRFGFRISLGIGAACVLVLVVLGVFLPRVALGGWLVGFVSVAGIVLGSVACVAIHGLTGGRWGEAARPSLLLAAAAVPLLLLLGCPLILGSWPLYPWAADPGSAGPGVAAAYLNPALVGLRSLVLIGGLWGFVRLMRQAPMAPRTAGFCLLLYVVGMNLSAFDWLLSLSPRFTSSAFGAQVIVAQLASALAFAILTLEAEPDAPVWGDLGGLLFATLLGETYLVLMSFVVQWYGNLPEAAAWYLRRTQHGWLWLEAVGSLAGAVGPLVALLFSRVRHSPWALRPVAATVLAGVVAENIWYVAPETGGWTVLAGLVAVLAVGGLSLGFAGRKPMPGRPEWSVADGT